MIDAIRITKLDHVVVRARDLEKLVAFYCDVLGCSLERRSKTVEGLVHLRAGTSFIDIMRAGADYDPPTGGRGNMDHLCIQIEPFRQDEMAEYLARNGVGPGDFGRRFGADGDGISVYIRDPEGNEVELKAAPEPA
ncbi:MAG TPA: VOC family protein [Gammaproteobacteria bacterium]